MKSRMMKKIFAGAMSATLVMGMSLTAAAGSPTPAPTATPTVTAPIYSFDVENVVVPTTFVVAFNPDELTVKTGTSTTSTAQVLSKNYGILNKSTKGKIVTITLTVEDKNTGDNKVTFVASDSDATGAEAGEYAIHLAAVPADNTEVKVGATPGSADKDTDGDALADVSMTAAADEKAVTMKAGENKIAFKLDKAIYTAKASDALTLGGTPSNTSNPNDVSGNFELTGVAANGKGITGFTFKGAINKNADWTKLTAGIEISAVYSFANAKSTDTIIEGTGAMVNAVVASVAPTFTPATGKITYTTGSGNDGLASITKIEASWGGVFYDVTNQLTDDSNGNLTINAANVDAWGADPVPVKITYTNGAGTSVTTPEFNVTAK